MLVLCRLCAVEHSLFSIKRRDSQNNTKIPLLSVNYICIAYVPPPKIQILYTEQPLKDLTRALGNYGVKDGDVIVLRQADRRAPPTQPAFPGGISRFSSPHYYRLLYSCACRGLS